MFQILCKTLAEFVGSHSWDFTGQEGRMKKLNTKKETAHSLSSAASPRPDQAVLRAPTPPPVPCSRPSNSSIHPGTWLLA